MTGKEALEEAINIVTKEYMKTELKNEIVEGLRFCLATYPFSMWSQEVILDSCSQFQEDHGQIRLSDFGLNGLPNGSVIVHHFKMTPKDFRNMYFPLPRPVSHSKYRLEDSELWLSRFIDEYHRLRCSSRQRYNSYRDKSLPNAGAVCRLAGVQSWTQLLEKLDLPKYKLQQSNKTAGNQISKIDQVNNN